MKKLLWKLFGRKGTKKIEQENVDNEMIKEWNQKKQEWENMFSEIEILLSKYWKFTWKHAIELSKEDSLVIIRIIKKINLEYKEIAEKIVKTWNGEKDIDNFPGWEDILLKNDYYFGILNLSLSLNKINNSINSISDEMDIFEKKLDKVKKLLEKNDFYVDDELNDKIMALSMANLWLTEMLIELEMPIVDGKEKLLELDKDLVDKKIKKLRKRNEENMDEMDKLFDSMKNGADKRYWLEVDETRKVIYDSI